MIEILGEEYSIDKKGLIFVLGVYFDIRSFTELWMFCSIIFFKSIEKMMS